MAAHATASAETSEIAARIARTAAQLFATKGYDATSVRNIVEAAQVTKPTLYYYFESKEGLAQALLTVPMTRLIARLQGTLASDLSAAEKLAEVIEAQFAFCRDDPDRARFVYALFFGPLGSALSVELSEHGSALTGLMSEAVGGLAREGLIDEAQVGACTAALRGLVVIYTMDYLYRDLQLDTALAAKLVRDLIDGFGAVSRAAPPVAHN